MEFLLFLIVGAIAGVLAGLFGIGGGLVMVPVLLFTFAAQNVSVDIAMHMALATSLATIVFTSLSSVKEHHSKGAIDWSLVKVMSIGIVLGTFIGGLVIVDVPGALLQRIMGVFAILVAIKMFFGLDPKSSGQRPGNAALASAGGVIGFASAWFGIGGGTFSVPYLTWMKLSMRNAVATSAACGIPIALSGALINTYTGWGNPLLPEWSTGFLYWPAIIGMAVASVPMAKVGAKLAHRLDPALLKKLFALLLVIVGAKLLFF